MTALKRQKEWLKAFRAAGHKPRMYDRRVDTFVTASGFHNGPGCRLCGWTTCMHCTKPESIPKCEGVP